MWETFWFVSQVRGSPRTRRRNTAKYVRGGLLGCCSNSRRILLRAPSRDFLLGSSEARKITSWLSQTGVAVCQEVIFRSADFSQSCRPTLCRCSKIIDLMNPDPSHTSCFNSSSWDLVPRITRSQLFRFCSPGFSFFFTSHGLQDSLVHCFGTLRFWPHTISHCARNPTNRKSRKPESLSVYEVAQSEQIPLQNRRAAKFFGVFEGMLKSTTRISSEVLASSRTRPASSCSCPLERCLQFFWSGWSLNRSLAFSVRSQISARLGPPSLWWSDLSQGDASKLLRWRLTSAMRAATTESSESLSHE